MTSQDNYNVYIRHKNCMELITKTGIDVLFYLEHNT